MLTTEIVYNPRSSSLFIMNALPEFTQHLFVLSTALIQSQSDEEASQNKPCFISCQFHIYGNNCTIFHLFSTCKIGVLVTGETELPLAVLEEAATKIQAAFRGMHARELVKAMKLEKVSKSVYPFLFCSYYLCFQCFS